MKTNKFINKFLVSGLMLAGVSLTSCDDFLTVLPSDRITEDDFWKTETDLQGVRAACYRQLAGNGCTNKIFYWGEVRSDNLTLFDQTQDGIKHAQQAILMPTENIFKWNDFYTGINYCNLVLEQGEAMTQPGNEVDPSFRQSDWLPIKAEITALRALYYFYLVRAYRDVPYVTKAVRTDEEARARVDGQTEGVNIMGNLIADVEAVLPYAANNFGSSSENCGRFTRRGVQALLADMYLWRGCMLKRSSANPKPDVVVSTEGDTLTATECNNLATECFKQSIKYCDDILAWFQSEYDRKLAENEIQIGQDTDLDYPYLYRMKSLNNENVSDDVYSTIWGKDNATEAIFELKYDANKSVTNTTLQSYCSSPSGNSLNTASLVASSLLAGSASASYDPDRGFGKTDIRLLHTLRYDPNSSSLPQVHKNLISSLSINDLEDLTQGGKFEYIQQADQNFPIYRLADIFLIKAESIARSVASTTKATDNALVAEGFKLTNTLFERSNPRLKATGTEGAGQMVSDRLKENYATNTNSPKTAAELLTLVYNERQREFVAEGKRWFDIVRQCEATTETVTDVLTNYITLSTSVRNRLKQLYSLYNPIHMDEYKINGEEYGGNLKQNPVWARYSKN